MSGTPEIYPPGVDLPAPEANEWGPGEWEALVEVEVKRKPPLPPLPRFRCCVCRRWIQPVQVSWGEDRDEGPPICWACAVTYSGHTHIKWKTDEDHRVVVRLNGLIGALEHATGRRKLSAARRDFRDKWFAREKERDERRRKWRRYAT